MRHYEKNPANYPQTRFDLVKEAVISGGVATLLVVVAVLLFGVPYVKPLTIKKVATTQPVVFLRTAAGELADTSTIAQYGPPYNNGTGSLQAIGSFHPQTLLGVTQPINPSQVDVLKPLSLAAPLDPQIKASLAAWGGASHAQQQAWVNAYLGALSHAAVQGSSVTVPQAADGPVPAMLSTLHELAAGGLMSGALDRTAAVYRYNVAPSLLFLQGTALQQMAQKYDLLGGEWGIMHDELSYPGPWWLTPYTALYQLSAYSTSPAGDMLAAYTMLLFLVLLIALPFIPGVRDLPRRLRLYRIIWRDWYRDVEREGDPHAGDASGSREAS